MHEHRVGMFVSLTLLRYGKMKISITQPALEVVDVKVIIWLAISSIIGEKFVVVAVCKVEILIVITSDRAR